MPLDGEYEPSSPGWAADQTATILASGTTDSVGDGQRRVVLVTYRGRRSGKLRRMPVMRVEHEGTYAIVASLGGAPQNPLWYGQIVAGPQVELLDGTVTHDCVAHEASGAERALWWERAVAVFPQYAEYQERTERVIPVLVLEPADGGGNTARPTALA